MYGVLHTPGLIPSYQYTDHANGFVIRAKAGGTLLVQPRAFGPQTEPNM